MDLEETAALFVLTPLAAVPALVYDLLEGGITPERIGEALRAAGWDLWHDPDSDAWWAGSWVHDSGAETLTLPASH